MAYDCALADKGIKTALAMLEQPVGGPSARSTSRTTTAPTRSSRSTRPASWWRATRSTCMIGPIFSPAAQGGDRLPGQVVGIPQISIVGQPTDNLDDGQRAGLHATSGSSTRRATTSASTWPRRATRPPTSSTTTTPPPTLDRRLQESASWTRAGARSSSVNYIPMDDGGLQLVPVGDEARRRHGGLDLRQRRGAVRQAVPRLRAHGAARWCRCRTTTPTRSSPNSATWALGMIACDYYAWTVDNQQNKDFVAAYEKLYPGEKPTPQGYGGVAGRHDVRQGSGSHQGRRDSGEDHRGHGNHDHGHRRPAS